MSFSPRELQPKSLEIRGQSGSTCAGVSVSRRGWVASLTVRVGLIVLVCSCGEIPSRAQTAAHDLTNATLEDLMNIKVTSVAKKEQKLSRTGASIYVITEEDIRRSGATNVPDLLRLAPGVNVQQVTANRWAIGIRGFSDIFANKVLVLIDGRSVYNPIFSGVFWDGQNVPIEDISRIEVIRGPGGTVWGANAVNGVINIITKSTAETEGALISAGAGSEEAANVLMQYGGKLGRTGSYRVYGSYFDTRHSELQDGGSGADGWHTSQGGFRSDWNLSPRDSMTVEGDLQRVNGGQLLTTVFSNSLSLPSTITDRLGLEQETILGRWSHTLKNGSETTLQIYDDHFHRVQQGFNSTLNTFDVDFQQHIAAGTRNDVVWGGGARHIDAHFEPGYSFNILPSTRSDALLSAFVQDEVKLADSIALTVGSKFEHNNFEGFEFEPSARLSWQPTSRQAIWASAARAIRQPSPRDDGMQSDATSFLQGNTLAVVRVLGNPTLKSEKVYDFEAGYRAQVTKDLSLDLAAFSSSFRDLQTADPQTPYFENNPGPPHLVLPQVWENHAHAHTYGGEFFANWSVTNRWRISPGFSTFHVAIAQDRASHGELQQPPGNSPEHQFQVRSLLNLSRNLEWDNTIAYVGRLTSVPAYTRLDSRLGWRIGEYLEFSVVGQNLLQPGHAEFPDELGIVHTEVERSVFGKVTWRF